MISKVSTFVLGLNLATLPASVAALLLPGVIEVLLVGIIVTIHRILLMCLGTNHHLLYLEYTLGFPDDLQFRDERGGGIQYWL